PCPIQRSSLFKRPTPTALYTLSLHDALPISRRGQLRPVSRTLHRRSQTAVHQLRQLSDSVFGRHGQPRHGRELFQKPAGGPQRRDRKSTRLNSSHDQISYAVFCLKKKSSEEI